MIGKWILFPAALLMISSTSMAKPGSSGSGATGLSGLSGNTSFGFYGGIVNTSQNDLNTLQARANINQGGITTSALNQAWEIAPFVEYRISGTMFALQLRPSYFYERQDGSGSAGHYAYAVTGWTVFPMLKFYPLENDFMKFYMQVGLGYGQVSGMVSEGAGNTCNFGSGSFGSAIGIGAMFFLTANQAISFEGNYRYLDFDRNIVTSASGTFNSAQGSLSQYTVGREAELDGGDLALRMGGLMFLGGYNYYF